MASTPSTRRIVVLLIALTVRGAAPARAEHDHDVGVYFDPGATAKTRDVRAFDSVDAFVIAWNLQLPSKADSTVLGFELGIHFDDRLIPVAWQVLPYVPGANPVDLDDVPGDDNWIVRAATCLDGSGIFRLLRYSVLLIEAGSNAGICVTPPDPLRPGFAVPGYVECDERFVPFGLAASPHPAFADGCGVINPTAVPAPATSWSVVKARFALR